MSGSVQQSHLDLLRKEHIQLQGKYFDLKRRYDTIVARSGADERGENAAENFAASLLKTIHLIYSNGSFSDIVLKVEDEVYKAHRFLIQARSSHWDSLESRTEIVLEDVSVPLSKYLFRWLYIDAVDPSIEDFQLLELSNAAIKYEFHALKTLCVDMMTARLDVANCVYVYEFAEREGLETLKEKCIALTAARWHDFKPHHFSSLSAPLLFRLLKGNSNNVLHSIVQLNREDALFLYFIENDSNLVSAVNLLDDHGMTALELALSLGYNSFARQLLDHSANVNLIDSLGRTILIRRILENDVKSCEFLVNAGSDLQLADSDGRSVLHHVALLDTVTMDMQKWISTVISDWNVNSVDKVGRTALVESVSNERLWLVEMLLKNEADPNIVDAEGRSALNVSLFDRNNIPLADILVASGAVVNEKTDEGNLIHKAVMGKESAVLGFLLQNKCDIDAKDSKANTSLHHAVRSSWLDGCKLLLGSGATIGIKDSEHRTSLHLAIELVAPHDIAATLVEHLQVSDFLVTDGDGRTAVELALEKKLFKVAELLIKKGTQFKSCNMWTGCSGSSLLIQSLLAADDETAVFLLNHNAPYTDRDIEGRSCLEIAVSKGLTSALRALCACGININERTDNGTGYTVLERAFASDSWECAEVLMSLGCDRECWTETSDGSQTLLHLCLDEGNHKAAVFLIEHGCNVNEGKKYNDSSLDDGYSPLHMAVAWALDDVVLALVGAGADLSAQDVDGRTACHIAVREGNAAALTGLLVAKDVAFVALRDKLGQTPLSLAIQRRDHKAASEIVNRVPHAALQTNGNGENLLHIAVKSNDLESVLFLLGTHTDATRCVSDSSRQTALHLAANVDEELIMRNLILAGCCVDAVTSDGETPMHEAAQASRANLVAILLENGADANIANARGETVLLTAVRAGATSSVRVLLSHANVESKVVNKNGQSSLHLAAALCPDRMEKGTSAAEMADLILLGQEHGQSEREWAGFVDLKDFHGNSALLVGYQHGQAAVCRSLLRRGATIGTANADGISVFNYETPTKQLLFGLLDCLEREPRWSDGDACECGVRFSITQRKHHCRHCGRLVCSGCSPVQMPIAKFGEEKKVRVCSLCAQVLTNGAPR